MGTHVEERSALTKWTTLRDVSKSDTAFPPGPLQRLEGVASNRKSLIAIGGALGLFFAGVAGRFIPPTYEASASLVVGRGWFDKDPNAASRSETAMNTEVQIAKSDPQPNDRLAPGTAVRVNLPSVGLVQMSFMNHPPTS